ncbi:MAG: alginate export family protein, partial [Pseudomonas sp.]
MKHKHWIGTGLGLGISLLSASLWAAQDAEKNFGLDLKISAQSEDDRDLGTQKGGEVSGLGLDLRPWFYGRRGDWSAYAMGQAVTATDIVETDPIESRSIAADSGEDNRDARQPDESYLALREFWVDYGGLTAYPGEHLRFGRQRVRSDEGTWWDTNIEALRWTFDSTLLSSNIGVAERFSDYRTDLDDLAPQDEDRQHLFGDLSTQWRPGQRVGLKLHHSRDNGELPEPGAVVDELSKTYTGDLTWLGLNVDGDFFKRDSELPFNYWAQATWLTGQRDSLTQSDGLASGSASSDVNAWALDLGLRWTLDPHWKVGAAYAQGSGGGDEDNSKQFVQTGLESNRSA